MLNPCPSGVSCGTGSANNIDDQIDKLLKDDQKQAIDNTTQANLDPTACDPTDADGDPSDDICTTSTPTPPPP